MVARPVQKASEAFRRTCPYGQSIPAASERENSNERESAGPVRIPGVEKLWKDLGKITAEQGTFAYAEVRLSTERTNKV